MAMSCSVTYVIRELILGDNDLALVNKMLKSSSFGRRLFLSFDSALIYSSLESPEEMLS